MNSARTQRVRRGTLALALAALVGGGLLADGLGLGHRMDQKWPKAFALGIMVIGMLIATAPQENRANALVVAQALVIWGVQLLCTMFFFSIFAGDQKIMP